MPHWSDVYPHEIWTNILTFKGQVVDYKIGNRKREWETWTFRWDKHIRKNQKDLFVIQVRTIVCNDFEHEKAFIDGRKMVDMVKENYGEYQYN